MEVATFPDKAASIANQLAQSADPTGGRTSHRTPAAFLLNNTTLHQFDVRSPCRVCGVLEYSSRTSDFMCGLLSGTCKHAERRGQQAPPRKSTSVREAAAKSTKTLDCVVLQQICEVLVKSRSEFTNWHKLFSNLCSQFYPSLEHPPGPSPAACLLSSRTTTSQASCFWDSLAFVISG